ncbi:hypothetical protein SLEP1_g59434 [Rubroshorea leprosula]|uniref:Uncharacterized protein n=1 Tax=Rubroshorea leprosula TaxID=152421 RepID=A0AAV5MTV7_9ROSI|nr:hypothetical protein SLEP1_g59434 [Rubroshorea leprosula]
MIMVALWCTQMRPMDRPSMHKVVEMLEAELKRLQIPLMPLQFYPHEIQEDGSTKETNITELSSSWLCNLMACGTSAIGISSSNIFLVYKWQRSHLFMYNSVEEFLQNNNNLMPISKVVGEIQKATGQDFVNEVATIRRTHRVNVV